MVRRVWKKARILFLTHADTDLLTLYRVLEQHAGEFPPVEGWNLNRLENPLPLLRRLRQARYPRILLIRLLGALQELPWLEAVLAAARVGQHPVLLVSGTGEPDPHLSRQSTVPPSVLQTVQTYLEAGGPFNCYQMLRYVCDHFLFSGLGAAPPRNPPRCGLYHPDWAPEGTESLEGIPLDPYRPTIGVLFYRAHWISGNLSFVDALIRTLERIGLQTLPVFAQSLRQWHEGSPWEPEAFRFFRNPDGTCRIEALVSTMAFSMSEVQGVDMDVDPAIAAFIRLGVPVIQAIPCSTSRQVWLQTARGLGPVDTAMHVALPELDGRLITVPISFKEPVPQTTSKLDVSTYVSDSERVQRMAGLTAALVRLRRTPPTQKKIAILLTNAGGKADRVGNAVGLDTPNSLIALLKVLREAGYAIKPFPEDGSALMQTILDQGTYDLDFLTESHLARAPIQIPLGQYSQWFQSFPQSFQEAVVAQWGPPPGKAYVYRNRICLFGLNLGGVWILPQPPRGYGLAPEAIYHRPDLPPPHYYIALYRWLERDWGVHALIHLGKHGTLEWLPGKGVGLSEACAPDGILGNLPLFYPFIVNDPGEGAQAKRRAHAVIIDHLIPPLTRAELYGDLAQLMERIEEYYQAESLDPSKLPLIQEEILKLVQKTHLAEDLEGSFSTPSASGSPDADWRRFLETIDGYLCELAGLQIRAGLHVLGQTPEQDTLVDLLWSLVRMPNLEAPGLREMLCRWFGLSLESMLRDPGRRVETPPEHLRALVDRPLHTAGDLLEGLEELGWELLARLQQQLFRPEVVPQVVAQVLGPPSSKDLGEDLIRLLKWICTRLVPALEQTPRELHHLLQGLEGRYVPAGPSGAPTRGCAHVFPTGRNFYTIDPRAIPSRTAWKVGQALAREVLDRYLREQGQYPETVGITIWGTSTIRTQGDDVAEVFALLGVRPIWKEEGRRLEGIEVIPLEVLGRPRIDVVVRISGFFRDAFPQLIQWMQEAVNKVASLEEPPEWNYVRKHVLEDERHLSSPHHRIFGPPPGTYGAGLLPLIEERNWKTEQDFAAVYLTWGGYAYTGSSQPIPAKAQFQHHLSRVEIALHNQDNREHDILDSDDYFQFHGGMIATIRALTERIPRAYFGDTQDPERIRVRDLQQEILRVFRARVVNPKWLERIRQHGYKGGLEMAATVDYLFGFDATAQVVEDWMYEQMAQAYLLDPEQREFLEQHNPWALRSMTRRLLEAMDRGLWAHPDPAIQETLLQLEIEVEALMEAREEGP